MINRDEEKILLGKKIRQFREEKNFSQNQLGRKIAVSPQNIGKYEQGITVPSALVVKRMAQVFGVTADTLLNENGQESRVVNVKNVELLKKIEQVDKMEDEDKKAIERIIDFALLKYSVKKLQAA